MSRKVKSIKPEDENSPTKKRPSLLRILIFGFLGLIPLIILAGYILVRNVDDILITKIEDVIGAETEISDFKFNPFRGFTLEGFSILFPGDTISQKIDELRLSYSIPALLKKEIRITGLTISAPKLYLSQNSEGQWNIFSRISTDSLKTASDTLPKTFPVKFSIKRAAINDLRCKFNTSKGELNIFTGKFEAKDIHFSSIDDFKAEFEFDEIKGELKSTDSKWELSFETEAVSALDNHGGEFQIAALVSLASSGIVFPEFNFKSNGRISLADYSLYIDTLECISHKDNGFRASGSGSITEFDVNPIYDFSFIVDEFNCLKEGWIQNTVQHFTPSIPDFNLELFEPTKLRLEGIIPAANGDFIINCNFEHSSFINDFHLNREIYIDDITVDIEADFAFFKDSLNINRIVFGFDAGEAVIRYEPMPEFRIMNFTGSAIIAESEGEGKLCLTGSNDDSVEMDVHFRLPSNAAGGSIDMEYLDSLTIVVRNAAPVNYGFPQVRGAVNAWLKSYNRDGLWFMAELTASDTLKWLYDDSTAIDLPFDTLTSSGLIKTGGAFTDLSINNLNVNLSNWMRLASFIEISRGNAEIRIDSVRLDLVKAQKFYPHLFPGELDMIIEAAGSTSFSIQNPLWTNSTGFSAQLFSRIIGIDSISVEGMIGDLECSISNMSGGIKAELEIPKFKAPVFRERPISDIKVTLEAVIDFTPLSLSFYAEAVLPSESMDITLSGDSRIHNSILEMDLQLASAFADTNWVEILPDLKITGGMDYNLSIVLDSMGFIEGEVSFADFGVLTSYIECSGVGGRVPLQQTINIKPFRLLKGGGADNPFYDESRPYLTYNSDIVDNIRADKLNLFNRDMFDISADAFWEEGYFRIPHFQVSLFEGNLVGSGCMRTDSLLSGELSYEISAQGAEINSDMISQLSSKGKGSSRISFNLDFSGTQIDPSDPRFDLEGYLHITKISPKVAENLLLALDPQQQDKGIQSTLYFLKRGWGIRSFSFQASHGFVYSTIITQQPSINKPLPFFVSRILPLEKEIRMSRLPLKFFLNR